MLIGTGHSDNELDLIHAYADASGLTGPVVLPLASASSLSVLNMAGNLLTGTHSVRFDRMASAVLVTFPTCLCCARILTVFNWNDDSANLSRPQRQ